MKKRLLSILLAVITVTCVFLQTPVVTYAANDTVRDTVLVLDCSGSMRGDPMANLIKSADKFCESLLNASGTNRVALVTYDTDAQLRCDFTDDFSAIQSVIHNMSDYATTNIYDALRIAGDLLSTSSANVKNIVLMSDGLPNEGSTADSGRYSYSDYDGYAYANAVYNEAVSFHADYFIYTLGFFHNLYGDTKAFASRFMEDLQNAGYYEVDKVDDLEFTFGEIAEEITESKLTGTFKYPCTYSGKDSSSTYYYADEYFYESSLTYNPSLATMSLCLALSAYGSADVSSYKNKSVNVKNLLEELMFTDFETTKSFQEKPTADSIAAAAAQKKIKDDQGNVFTLIAVAVRGGGYEQEWASNFTVGSDGDHSGFKTASDDIFTFIKGYVSDHKIEGDVKLWITGYSRAAATSNLIAARIDKGTSIGKSVSLQKKDLFAYCFETPKGTTDQDAMFKSKYGNIFNIVNPNDPVPKVAHFEGFNRYGIDLFLPTAANKYRSYSSSTDAMLKEFKKLEGVDDYDLDEFTYLKVDFSKIVYGVNKVVYDSEHQIPMSVFLDEVLYNLAYGYMDRSLYSSQIESGVRELCKAVFQDESKWKAIMRSTVLKICDNIDVLVKKLVFDRDGLYEQLAIYLIESFKENGATGFNEKNIKEASKPLLKCFLAYCFNDLDHGITLFKNLSHIGHAHFPEICLAWMRSMDENYTTDAGEAFSSGSYRIIRINCPVDVNVFDAKGTLVATIVDGKAQPVDGSSIVSMINSDGEKVVYLPADAEFKLEIKGTDSGNVNYSVNEFSYDVEQINRIVNYYDVPIEKDKTLKAVVPAYNATDLSDGTANGSHTNYQLSDMNGKVLSPDLDVAGDKAIHAYHTVTATSENEEHGVASGSGIRQTGSFAQVTAIANEGYAFEGWYSNEEKVSSEPQYRFRVTSDVTVVAKFTKTQTASAGIGQDSWWIILVVVIVLGLLLLSGKKAAPVGGRMVSVPSPGGTPSPQPISNVPRGNGARCGLIRVRSGPMNGFSVPVYEGETLCLGKDPRIAQIVLSGEYTKVSRAHCSVSYDADSHQYYVTDNSSNGTYLPGKKRLVKGARTPVNANTVLTLGNEECTILLE